VRKLIALTITVIMLLFPAQVLADSAGPLSFERAKSLLALNNNTVKKLQRAERDAQEQYESARLEWKSKDVNGMTYTYKNKEYYYHYNADTRDTLTKYQQFVPEQLKYVWEATADKLTITQNTLNAALRSVFLGVYNAQEDLELKQRQLEYATDVNHQDQLKLKNGIITELDLEESDYNLLKAQKAKDASQRNYENAVRTFNQFAGLPSSTQYTQITYGESLKNTNWKPVDEYVEIALKSRFDVVDVQKQIALKELDKKLTEAGTAYKMNTTDQDTYASLLTEIENLKLDLEEQKLIVANEVRNAYTDVIKAGKSLNNMGNTLKLQQSSHNKMKERYEAGMISRNTLTQSELGLQQVENSYNLMLFDYNTKIMKFNNATGIGPEY
jgi:outer membrane protein TolC